MEKYKIQSNLLQNGKWQPAYLEPQGINGVFSEPIEFAEEKFDTKNEADNFAMDYLMKRGIKKDEIEIN
ncbi:MAG: hypothetical protein A2998_03425 [Candidatus Staskawiczbacteria bacterium RIFCSPLOWO2_01_FULL_37_25b]|uniref:Uncharacterized protein n=1 Tax=Candidatus Staskawiczbacteria bacterium RIFCSPLOWO2_01_FULL_37_25b TaxID=1802213 RepID=A0A1G2ICL8_9BACT|nr:MAG: hypothetical protein A2998_03425 [Candidatus Staskawiczbacteria bacterium RIFCSPLOWO2_01_FULL_37_25b]